MRRRIFRKIQKKEIKKFIISFSLGVFFGLLLFFLYGAYVFYVKLGGNV